NPVVSRLGDTEAAVTSVYSVPNFFGAHGYDSKLQSMSAILFAAGPDIAQGRELELVHNIDVAPTVLKILGVTPAPTVDGTVILGMLNGHDH
ncbi:MAG: phosphodiesterase, partial [Pseudomonadota bacterium]|nr:phosphodiesterase [Pseudomonadota bacterium]